MTILQLISVGLFAFLLSTGAFVRSTQLDRHATAALVYSGRSEKARLQMRSEAWEIVGILLVVVSLYLCGIGVVRWIS